MEKKEYAPTVFMAKHESKRYYDGEDNVWYCGYMTVPHELFGEDLDDLYYINCREEITFVGTIKDFIDRPIIPIAGNILQHSNDDIVIGWDFNHLVHHEKGLNDDLSYCKQCTLDAVSGILKDHINK